MTSQITSEPTAMSWERIIQMMSPVRLGWGVGGGVSVIELLKLRWSSAPKERIETTKWESNLMFQFSRGFDTLAKCARYSTTDV